ncbi:MAG: bifunctional UDP-sugar hydrolase/5'-nucleotidase, partial [bacterium]|nr:bifunctional UDP-sugar hydrolase/5'-nucleotidase [bacterium]
MRVLIGFLVGWMLVGSVGAQEVAVMGGGRDSVTVRILHSNDLYGQLGGQHEGDQLLGGMAARVYLIRTIQETGPTLVLNGGDAIGPATLSAWDKGKTVIAAMKRAGYTAMTLGNHEFDYGLEELNKRHEEAGFPFLVANMVGKGGTETPTTGYLLVDLEGVKVGIVGLVSQDIATQVNPKHVENLTFTDPAEAGQKAVQALREQGADYLIALVHMREQEVLALVQKLDGVDLVVAGGFRGAERTREMRSLIRMANGMHIVSTPRYGLYLGQVAVRFVKGKDGGYRAVRTDADLIPVDEDVETDPETTGIVSELEEAYTRATAKTLGGIEGETLDAQAELVATLIRTHTKTEVGIINRGTFRKIEPQDTLRLRDVNQFIRFDDTLVKMILTGKQLKNIVKK